MEAVDEIEGERDENRDGNQQYAQMHQLASQKD
jgi:hypothetical protein